MLPFLASERPRYALIEYRICEQFDQIVKECANRNEQGGILIGGCRAPHIDVVEQTFPASDDKSSLYSFERSGSEHQRKAEQAWRRSECTLSYIGDWHSHPSGPIAPSSTDIAAWKSVACKQGPQCVFVLATPEGWGAFRISKLLKRVVRLAELERGTAGIVFG